MLISRILHLLESHCNDRCESYICVLRTKANVNAGKTKYHLKEWLHEKQTQSMEHLLSSFFFMTHFHAWHSIPYCIFEKMSIFCRSLFSSTLFATCMNVCKLQPWLVLTMNVQHLGSVITVSLFSDSKQKYSGLFFVNGMHSAHIRCVALLRSKKSLKIIEVNKQSEFNG